MAHTKKLLEAGNIDDILQSADITVRQFKNDSGEVINYNSLVLTFENGDTVTLKCTPELKAAVFYAHLQAAK